MSQPKSPAYRKHGFTLCLIGAIVLALLCPEPGVPGGTLRVEWTTNLGVWIIFFIQGLSLPGRELAAGYKPLRLHAFVLSWNFLIFPLLTFLYLFVLARFMAESVPLGFGLLSILPTTIASAVAFTGLAGGRVANALCATVLSNALAVFIVPLWVAFYLASGESVELPLLPLLWKLSLLIVLPMILGQILRGYLAPLVGKAAAWLKRVSSAIIIYIVYVAFAGSVASGFFEALSIVALLLLILEVVGLLLLASAAVWWSVKTLRLEPDARIAAFFCASQKSMATGLPLATAIFAVIPETVAIDVGAVLLPLIIYHPLQLLLAAAWAGRGTKGVS